MGFERNRGHVVYSTTDLGFGPKLHGAISVPKLPLKKEDAVPGKVLSFARVVQFNRRLAELRAVRADTGREAFQIHSGAYTGASPALFAWDLWNEMHPAHGEDDPAACEPFAPTQALTRSAVCTLIE